MRTTSFVLVALGLLGPAVDRASAQTQTQTLQIPRVTEPPVLERYVDGTTVPPGVKVTGFRQREPGDGVPASQETTVYLSYDTEHLYVVFVCRDDPARVRANLTRREAIMSDDFVGLVLDTYHDGRRAYLFLTNPLGIQMDGVATEGQEDDYSYDALWRSEGRLTDDGYVVLMAIPFKSLRFSNQSEQTWGIAVARSITRANETSFWPYVTRRIASVGQQLATLDGVEGVSPGRNLQAIPYGTFAAAQFLDDEGARTTDHVGSAGLDAKAVIKDAVTVDLTVNPDFSQVESDEPQVTINQRFEVFFPEKRPFFIENAGYFETPQQLFFSRRVADPGVGGRVTARSRGWAVGGLLVNDDQPGETVAEDDPRFDTWAGIGVVRVQRELARQSHVGGIFTDREFGDSANRVYGVDGRWRFDDNWSATGQWVGSYTRDVGRPGATGRSAYAGVSREGRAFDYQGGFLSRSPDFQADLGYVPRVDLLQTDHEARYMWFPTGRALLSFGPELETSVLWDYDGNLEEWTVEPALDFEFPGQTEVGIRHWQTFERYVGIDFRRHTSAVYADTQWLSWLTISAFARWGTGINYYPAEGLAPFLADSQTLEAGVTFRPTSQLRVDGTYLFSRLSTREDAGLPPGTPGGDVFNNHIGRARANYQFTRELSARFIVDYEAVLPNESLVSLEREKRLGFDVLFTYLLNPWTAVYVGYTDTYENWLAGAPTEPPLVRGGAPTTSVGRQVFVKASYLLRH
jgi:opacity protein-like surface antigen